MPGLIAAVGRSLGLNPVRWLRDTLRMRALIRGFDLRARPAQDRGSFAVVIMPWLGTAVPWFSLVCGLLLAANGRRVSFIIDDVPFGGHRVRFRFLLGCIRAACNPLRSHYRVLELSQYLTPDCVCSSDPGTIDRLADLNAVWELRGESSQRGRAGLMERSTGQLRTCAQAIANLLQGCAWDAILIPGGVYGSSGVWAAQASRAGVRVASYDSGGPGIVMLAASGIACQLQDIPRAMSLLQEQCRCAEERRFVIAAARAEIERRRSGTDRFASQVKDSHPVGGRFDGAVLLALNCSWDSAALGLHAIFRTSAQWMLDTAKYLLQHSTVPVVVRQHPAERSGAVRSSDDYRDLLTRHIGSHPRLHFIAADEPVNSYELLERVRAVVVHTSTFGVEAAINGKPVVTASRSYYSQMGFVWRADTLEAYHEHLRNAAAGAYSVSQAMRDEALLCYYLTQCCNWVASPFSPESFASWSRSSLAELSRDEMVRMTVQSLADNVPVAFLSHLATRRSGGAP